MVSITKGVFVQLVKSLVYQRWTISPAGEIRTIPPKLDAKMLGKQTNKNRRCTKHISCIIQYYPAPSVYVVKILQDIYFLIHNLWISDLTSHELKPHIGYQAGYSGESNVMTCVLHRKGGGDEPESQAVCQSETMWDRLPHLLASYTEKGLRGQEGWQLPGARMGKKMDSPT